LKIDLTVLTLFLRAEEHGSISAAARELGWLLATASALAEHDCLLLKTGARSAHSWPLVVGKRTIDVKVKGPAAVRQWRHYPSLGACRVRHCPEILARCV
jgi:hypothetical protein